MALTRSQMNLLAEDALRIIQESLLKPFVLSHNVYSMLGQTNKANRRALFLKRREQRIIGRFERMVTGALRQDRELDLMMAQQYRMQLISRQLGELGIERAQHRARRKSICNTCLMSYCQCEFTRNPRAEARASAAARRSAAGRSRSQVGGRVWVGLRHYDQWKLSVKSENHTPSSVKRRSSKRPPNLTNLGRASDEQQSCNICPSIVRALCE